MRPFFRSFLFSWLTILPMAWSESVAAPPEIALENVPLHLASCAPVNQLLPTTATLSSAEQNASSYLYQASFNPATGSGSLKKIKPAFAAMDGSSTSVPFEWDAARLLTDRTNPRRIYTSISTENGFSGIPFIWSYLSVEQKSFLNRSPHDGSDDQLGEKRLNYLRGSRVEETAQQGNAFPMRTSILGAIVHGVPKYVGAPSALPEGNAYRAYFETNRQRKSVVYVGAENGMLHAFDAITGNELFAYIPQAVFSSLAKLTVTNSTQALPIDGGIDVADVYVENKWRNILVAGMGRGAQGVFALDVTTPERFDGADVLWEFSDVDDVDIGHVIGMPVIAKFKTGVAKGAPQYRYFAVVASGVNNHRNDGARRFNPAAPNALFLLALDKKQRERWTAGVNYFKFTTPGSDAKIANGMTEVTLNRLADGSVSHAYAGDMQGNLWRFDFSGNMPWSNALGTSSPQPLFVARASGGSRQPILQKVQIVHAPSAGHIVLFGTGKYLELDDVKQSGYATQSFYAVWDDEGKRISGRGALTERTLQPSENGNTLEISGNPFRYGMSGAGDKGWYVDFIDSNDTGERSVSPASLFGDQLVFRTLIPDTRNCLKPSGRLYVLGTLTGLPSTASFTVNVSDAGFPGVPIIVAAMPTEISERDATGKRRVKRKLDIVDSDNPAASEMTPERKTVMETVTTAGRLSWREIVNWLELRSNR